MVEQKQEKAQSEVLTHPSNIMQDSVNLEHSSDPNDWCPKHGPHPSD